MRFLDLHVPLTTLLISITVPALFGRVVFVPGSGTGVMAGMAAILAQTGGLTANEGAVIAILYRLLDMALPVAYGYLAWTLVPSPARRPLDGHALAPRDRLAPT